MSESTGLTRVFTFLAALRRHNNRPWFETHRGEYEAARGDFETFVGELIVKLARIEPLGGVRPKDCVRRIYRDIRFSADKTPYKTHMSAEIAPGGTKATRLPYYVHVAPQSQSMLAGGLYMPTSAQLVQFRQAIAENAKPFKRIVATPAFKKHFGALEGDRLKTTPKGFARNHAEIDLLRLTQIVAWEHVPDAKVTAATFATYATTAFTALKPFLDYLNETTS